MISEKTAEEIVDKWLAANLLSVKQYERQGLIALMESYAEQKVEKLREVVKRLHRHDGDRYQVLPCAYPENCVAAKALADTEDK